MNEVEMKEFRGRGGGRRMKRRRRR